MVDDYEASERATKFVFTGFKIAGCGCLLFIGGIALIPFAFIYWLVS